MNWQQAQALILQHIGVPLHLDPDLAYRFITEGPNYPCFQYNYNGAEGYRVQIGATNYVQIPFTMLETIFQASVQNGGIYNNGVFAHLYPQQLNNHGCHVHVVGKIFEWAGVAIQDGANYIMQ